MIFRFVIGFVLTLAAAFGLWAAPALGEPGTEQQRRDYLAALDAAKSRDLRQFSRIMDREHGYLLYGYLQYEFLKDRISVTPAPVLSRFLEENKDAAVSDALRKKWLRYLAERGDWDTFIKVYPGAEDDIELKCYRLGYLLKSGPEEAGVDLEVQQLWLTGNRQPASCETMFTLWRNTDHLTPDLVWARIKLAMERRNVTLAAHLANYLETKERVWVDRWIAMYRNPLRELEHIHYPLDTPVARGIVVYGVVRLAGNDPEVAMTQWKRVKEEAAFTPEDDDQVMRALGVIAAQSRLPEALDWLSAVSAKTNDATLREWRMRAAIASGRWDVADHFYPSLTETEQRDNQWRYWKARILEKLGEERAAKKIYRELAKDRSYYGFLAADRLGQDYSMQHVGVEAKQEEMVSIMSRPAIQMAQELFILGQAADARRQWAWATRNMSNRELQVAAVIAARWGWHDRAILTLTRTDRLDDLELRFPLLYREYVEANAQAANIDPGWVYGVMRQESAFVTDARSPVGALGLMQLMPHTGRLAGRLLKLKIRDNNAILDIENNLRLGTYYLKTVLDEYNGHQVLATAAYNAGPNRVRDWIPAREQDADVWVDSIPYNETRNYVKNVLGFTTVYDYRLGNTPIRLQQRMLTVAPLPD